MVCDLPPMLPQGASRSSCRALTGFSKSTYKRMRRYAFWKLRKGHSQKRLKELNPCSESSSESQSMAFCHDSLSLPSCVTESALADNDGTGEGQCTSGDVADSGPSGQVRGEPQDNAAVSKCILRAVWSRVAVRGIGYSVPSQSGLAGPLPHTVSNCQDPTVFLAQTAQVSTRGRSPTFRVVTLNPKPVFSERPTEPLTPRALRFRPEPMRGPTPVGFQVSTSSGSGLEAYPQTGEYQIQQAVLPGRVCLRTCSGPQNAMVSRPKTATYRSDLHTPRSRSLGSGLPLVLKFNSSGGARRCNCKLGPQQRSAPTRTKSSQLLPRISQHAPAPSEPTYPAGAGGESLL